MRQARQVSMRLIDDSAGPGYIDGIAEELTLPAGCEESDVALQEVVVDRYPAVFVIAHQISPIVQGIGDGIPSLGVGHDLLRDRVEPRLECIQDRDAVFLAKAGL